MAIRFSNIILALLIFFSSTGFTVNSHYCQNELKGVNVFLHPKTCHEKQSKASCHKEAQTSCELEKACKNGCCTNTSDYVKLDQDQQFNGFEFKAFDDPVVIAALWLLSGFNFADDIKVSIEYLNYKPPLLDFDFPAVLQSFLL